MGIIVLAVAIAAIILIVKRRKAMRPKNLAAPPVTPPVPGFERGAQKDLKVRLSPSASSHIDELEKIAQLREKGFLTETEYETEKKRILGRPEH